MKSTSTEKNTLWKRLEITSAGGMCHLHFQFNFPSEDKVAHQGEYQALTLLMYTAFREIYQKMGLNTFQDKDHYELSYTDNFGGFHFSIRWAYAYNAEEALAVAKQALDYALLFDVNTHVYENAEMKALVEENIEGAKDFAEEIRKDIFDEQRYEFEKDYYSPFD